MLNEKQAILMLAVVRNCRDIFIREFIAISRVFADLWITEYALKLNCLLFKNCSGAKNYKIEIEVFLGLKK